MGLSSFSSEPLVKSTHNVGTRNGQEAHVSTDYPQYILPIAKSSQIFETTLEERSEESLRLEEERLRQEELRLRYLEGFDFHDSGTQSYNRWFLPTNGKEYHDCGHSILSVCNNVMHHPDNKRVAKIVKRSCDRFECPICGKSWILKTTKKMLDKIEWAQRNLSEVYQYRPIHVTVSLPEKDHKTWSDHANYSKNRTKVYRILKKCGLKGGALIPHALREKCKMCHGELIKRPLANSKGFEKACKECGCSESVWIYSPHFHVIGFGTRIGRIYGDQVSRIYKKTGYIIRNHEQRKDLGATIFYQLSHATKRDNMQVVTWFGELSRLKSKGFETTPNTEKNECPYCGYLMISYRGIDITPDLEESEFEGFYLLEAVT